MDVFKFRQHKPSEAIHQNTPQPHVKKQEKGRNKKKVKAYIFLTASVWASPEAKEKTNSAGFFIGFSIAIDSRKKLEQTHPPEGSRGL